MCMSKHVCICRSCVCIATRDEDFTDRITRTTKHTTLLGVHHQVCRYKLLDDAVCNRRSHSTVTSLIDKQHNLVFFD